MYLIGGVSEKEPHLDLHQPHLVKNTHQNKLYKTIDTSKNTCNYLNMNSTQLDASTKLKMVSELRRELNNEDTPCERALAILAEIRKLESKPKVKKVKQPKDRYMSVLGGYVLDMHQQGKLVGYMDASGSIRGRGTNKIIG